jgi:thioredoxin-related protein
MSKLKKSSHLESVDNNPTTGLEIQGDIKSAITKDREHIYMVGDEQVPYEEGFRMSVGQEKVPFSDIRSTFSHITQDKWDSIFGKKRSK